MALEAQGSIVYFSTTSANTTAAAGAVEQVVSFNGPSGSAGVIDVTSLESTAKEKLIGLRDEGSISFDINFVATASVQTKMRDMRAARTLSNIAIAFNDVGKTLAGMKCYVSGFAISGAVDNKITASVQCEISGPVTWTTWT
uniref:Putative tail protein n=1 Tax=viral metagenome TaxID=1070528 RepID=A0A6M3KKM0_9ZZZZ